MTALQVFVVGAIAAGFFYLTRSRREFEHPPKPGVYRVSCVRNQARYNLFALFDGYHWHEARLTEDEAAKCLTLAKRGYYWSF